MRLRSEIQPSERRPIDAIDVRLLDALSADARASVASLARLVGLSPPSVAERVRRLEESGVIEGYSARINPGALGLSLSAWLRIRPVPGQLRKVTAVIQSVPEITQCDRITGEDCFLALAHVRSVKDLERIVDQIIPFAMTTTSIVQSSPVAPRLPPLAE